jgi:hypothetical protein
MSGLILDIRTDAEKHEAGLEAEARYEAYRLYQKQRRDEIPEATREEQRKYQKEYQKEWRAANREKLLEYSAKSTDKDYQRLKDAKQQLGGYCMKCGITNFDVLDFDHVHPPEKLYNVAQMRNYRDDIFWTEVSKCRLLCANCHRLHTTGKPNTGTYDRTCLPY